MVEGMMVGAQNCFDLWWASVQAAAELIAQKQDWRQLYDCERLHETKVPVASASYYEVCSTNNVRPSTACFTASLVLGMIARYNASCTGHGIYAREVGSCYF